MKILALSDLHLNHYRFDTVVNGRRIEADADVIVLAGDIDEGTAGIRWARRVFSDKPIVYVAGNHEFYGYNWNSHLDAMREEARRHDVFFLETERIVIDGFHFLGATLWTDFELFGQERKEEALQEARRFMSDYRAIEATRTPENHWLRSNHLVPELTIQRHLGSLEWLTSQFAGIWRKKAIVVTHHAPHRRCIAPQYADDLCSSAFASDLHRFMGKSALWIHGHMHDSVDFSTVGTRVVCNPRGYCTRYGDVENHNFDPAKIIEIV